MAAPDGGDEADDDGEWRFSLSDLEDDPADSEGTGDGEGSDGEDDAGGSGVAGSFSPSETIEPGEIDRENALFVLVGVAIALSVVGLYALALL